MKSFLISVILLLSMAGLSAGRSYYISTQGSDSNSGSLGSPWASLQHAFEVAGAADTVFMRGGVYQTNEVQIRRDRGMGGSNGQYLTIKNYPGEVPSVGGDRFMIVEGPPFLRIEGLHFRLPYRISGGGEGFQVVNNTFEGPQPPFGAIEFFSDDGLVEGNVITVTGDGDTQDHGIYLHAGYGNTLRDNIISGTSGYAIHVYDAVSSGGERAANGYQDILIEGNMLSDSYFRAGIIISPSAGVEAQNIVIRGNTIFNNVINGIRINGNTHDLEIYNNTLYGNGFLADHPDDGSAISFRSSESHDATIKNNIIVMSTEIGSFHIQNRQGSAGITAERNLYWESDSTRLFGVIDSSAIYGDPLFVDPQNKDFRIQLLSPAVDAGVDVGLPFVGNGPDIGAFEFGFPDVRIEPSFLDFGEIEVGTSVSGIVRLKNMGEMAIDVLTTSLVGEMAERFAIVSGAAPFALEAGSEREVVVVFTPSETGEDTAVLHIVISGLADLSVDFPLRGIAIPVGMPAILVDSTTYDFGEAEVDSSLFHSFEISNIGKKDLEISAAVLTGANPDQFSLEVPGLPFIVNSDSSRTLVLSFKPSSAGPKNAVLQIESNDIDNDTLQISLTGVGLPVNVPKISVNSTSHDFGDVEVDTRVIFTFELTNSGNADLQILATNLDETAADAFFLGQHEIPYTLPPSESVGLPVLFSPSTDGFKSTTLEVVSNDLLMSPLVVSLSGNGKLSATGVEGQSTAIPQKFSLEQNYPNPFNPETEISYGLPVPASVSIAVYDRMGRQVAELFSGTRQAGFYRAKWDGKSERGVRVASGVYFCKMVSTGISTEQNFTKAIKMTLVR